MPDELVERARVFAMQAHSGQVKKGTDIPYFAHPECVARLLQEYGYDTDIVAAGYLHDTVEDTDTTPEQIRAQFGPRVAEIVAGCTEPAKQAPWRDRKEHTIESIREATLAVKLVLGADKLCNIRSLATDVAASGEKVWERFKRGKEDQRWYYQTVCEALLASTNPAPQLLLDYQRKWGNPSGISSPG